MRYDLHVHTNYSLCSTLRPEKIVKLAKKRGLDGIAVTDHNQIKGALKTSKLNKDKDFEVVVSTEVKTNKGDVLAYYINEMIKSRDVLDVIDEIKDQGGLAVIAHPFRFLPHLKFRYPVKKIAKKIDGIECFNSRTSSLANKRANRLSDRFKLAKTAGSDAHFGFELGKACTIFKGDLYKAIKKRKTKVDGRSKGSIIGGSMSSILRGKRKIVNRHYMENMMLR